MPQEFERPEAEQDVDDLIFDGDSWTEVSQR